MTDHRVGLRPHQLSADAMRADSLSLFTELLRDSEVIIMSSEIHDLE